MDFIVREIQSSVSAPSNLNSPSARVSSRPRFISSITPVRPRIRRSNSCPSISVSQGTPDDSSLLRDRSIWPRLRVSFIVQNLIFTVHTSVLAESSDVFDTMLRDPTWYEKEIRITDVKSQTFWLLMVILYHGWNTVQPFLGLDDVIELLYVAHKYNVKDVMPQISKFCQRNLCPDRAVEVLGYANLYGLNGLKSCCWSLIERNTKAVMRAESFQDIDWSYLIDILSNSRLTISEYELFEQVIRWCRKQICFAENRGKTAMEVLGVAVYKIRFPLMTPQQFSNVIETGILAWGEVEDLNACFRKNPNFCHLPRRNECYCRRHHLECQLCTGRILHRTLFTAQLKIHLLRKNAIDGRVNGRLKAREDCEFQGANGPPSSCECIKYLSCPAFPGTKTTHIMEMQGMLPRAF